MYLTKRFYILSVAVVLVLGFGYSFPPLFAVGRALLCLLTAVTAVDFVLLFHGRRIRARRDCPERFSNGDDNEIRLTVANDGRLPLWTAVVDEAPAVFQRRDLAFRMRLPGKGERTTAYQLCPNQRGVYDFGRIRVFVRTAIGLVERRYSCGEPCEVAVYPSYQMLNRYEFLAISNHLTDMGIKRIRKAGNQTEFEEIKDYVRGDDYRRINWKASARRHQLMVNVYRDERSQQIISVIDKGRVMQQSFRGMTLLDYSINAALVLSYVAIRRDDKAGLMTFADQMDSVVAPSRKAGQMQTLLESLYAQQTEFGETDFSQLCVGVRKNLSKRSLLVLYTNFSGMNAMRRQLPYLRQLAGWHRLLVVFFADDELEEYAVSPKKSTEEYYQHVIARKFIAEKRAIVSTLQRQGISCLLTAPGQLSVDVINKYLELKRDGALG